MSNLGIQCFDNDGNVIFDMSRSTTHILGIKTIGRKDESEWDDSITVNLSPGYKLWCYSIGAMDCQPSITISGNKINISERASHGSWSSKITIIYGEY